MSTARTRRRRVDWADFEPIGVGEALRNARERLGLTIEEAADQTRIRASHLIALEEEEFTLLPESVVGRGLLRAYASFLRLDAIELLGALEAHGRLVLHPAEIRRETRRPPSVQPIGRRLIGALAAIGLVLGLTVYVISQYRAFVADDAAIIPAHAAASLGSIATDSIAQTPIASPTSVPPSPTTPARPSATIPLVALPTQTVRPATPTATALPAPTATARSSPTSMLSRSSLTEVVVEARILSDCWLRVEVDDKASFEGTLEAREQRIWRGEKVTIQVANAGAVEIIHNGKSLGKLGTTGQARTVTWTR